MDNTVSPDELAIVSTALSIVQKDAERRFRGRVLCADGRFREFSREQAVDLIDKIGTLAGHERGSLRAAGLGLALEAGKWR